MQNQSAEGSMHFVSQSRGRWRLCATRSVVASLLTLIMALAVDGPDLAARETTPKEIGPRHASRSPVVGPHKWQLQV
jgi:hypothetical protein